MQNVWVGTEEFQRRGNVGGGGWMDGPLPHPCRRLPPVVDVLLLLCSARHHKRRLVQVIIIIMTSQIMNSLLQS